MMPRNYLQTGQITCHDTSGRQIPCLGSGQDAEFKQGEAWPVLRFETQGDIVVDTLTGLLWPRDANLPEFPMTWPETFEFVTRMNETHALGRNDWRVPNRRELRSLISHQTRRPALPQPHPFNNVFPNWYWTSTTSAISPAHAWYVHMDGGRMFYGGKDQSFMLWPVAGKGRDLLPSTGQISCYDLHGKQIPCPRTGQDGETQLGFHWTEPRFVTSEHGIEDRLTGLCWHPRANLSSVGVTWDSALQAISKLNTDFPNDHPWRLPNINELESLVDCSRHTPALPETHPFIDIRDVYWSSTTSMYEPDWAWALYLNSGAVGVGQKNEARFFVWAVRNRLLEGEAWAY